MLKYFNITGLCIDEKHYMVNINEKIKQIEKLIDRGEYFTINRSRQYGKTTTLNELSKQLSNKFFIIKISFEGLGSQAFSSEQEFIDSFIGLVSKRLRQNKTDENIINAWEENKETTHKLEKLSDKITKLVEDLENRVVLMIDEVDKSSNNQMFLHFLGMLRNKYLDRNEGVDKTFKSVILAGVYDVKNLKLKLRPGEEAKYNSPWNIASDFDVDMSFNPKEISTMLVNYEKDYSIGMDIDKISEEIYSFTNGYPFLVSKICKLIDEKLDKDWNSKGIKDAVKLLLDDKNTLFDDLIKNLENNKELYNLVYDILIEGKIIQFNIHNPLIDLGVMLGILSKYANRLQASNKIFELIIYNYMISKRSLEKGELVTYEYRTQFEKDDRLDMELVISKFQEIMHDEFRDKDTKFIEREGRLLFLCFLKPIINGKGFYYVEPETRMDNRMDIVVTFGEQQHIIELKIWHGENYEQNAIAQIVSYLDSKREDTGYLVSFNFNKNKEYTKQWIEHGGKKIFAVVV